MKTKVISLIEKGGGEVKAGGTVSLQRAKEIAREEGVEYTEEELKEMLHFLSTLITITTAHYERIKQKEAKLISINTNTTHETASLSIHPGKYRRAS